MKLTKLPNGDWVDLGIIRMISIFPGHGIVGPRVVLRTVIAKDDFMLLYCSDNEEARDLRDRIAAMVNGELP